MAVLFQNAGEQLGAAEAGLGQTLFKGALTLYDKLDQAEQTSQFNVGQTQLTNAMNQFDYQRSTKGAADFLQWQDQNTKAMDEAWATIEKTIPNQGAKNQLNDWWQGQKESRSRRIESDIINARINQLGGQYDTLRKNEIDSHDPVELKVSNLTLWAQQYSDMGAVDARKAQDQLWVDAHALYKNGNLSAIQKKMEAEGTQAGFDWGNDPDSTYGQRLTPEDRAQNAEAAKRSREASLALQQKKATVTSNDSLTTVTQWVAEEKIPDDAIARITGKAQKPEDNLKFPSVMDGKDAVFDGSKQQQAALKMIEIKTKQLRGGSGSANPTTKQHLAYGALKEKIYARAKDYEIDDMVADINKALNSGDIVGTQYDKLLTLTGQAKNKDVAEVMGQLSKGLAHNDPVTGQPVGWYDSEVYSKIMSMTEDYIAAQHDAKGVSTIDSQKLHAYVDELTNKTMDQAIGDYLNGQYVSPIKFLGIKFGEKIDPDKVASALSAFSSKDTYATGQGKSIMGVLKADLGETLAKKGITGDLQVGNFNGTIYPALIAKDGIYGYFTEKGTAVIKKSTDGKTWQTLK